MAKHKVGYLIGSLARDSINRKLAKALVQLAPPELEMKEISFKDLPLYCYDYDADFPPVVHPMVFTQPDTGRKVLNISPFGALHILGQDDAEGHALLQRLVDHLVACPAYYHGWKPSEMLLWDNWRMLHCAKGVQAHIARSMQRTTIAGDYALGRWAEPMRSGIAQPTVMV